MTTIAPPVITWRLMFMTSHAVAAERLFQPQRLFQSGHHRPHPAEKPDSQLPSYKQNFEFPTGQCGTVPHTWWVFCGGETRDRAMRESPVGDADRNEIY